MNALKEAKPLLEVILVLIITLGVLTSYSLIDYKLSFEVELKKSKIKRFVLAPPPSSFVSDMLKASLKQGVDSVFIQTRAQAPKIDSSQHKILLTGDSMCEGLMFRFKEYAAFNEHELKTVIWYSSTTEWWSESDSLRKLVKQYDPDYIFFTTGSNELFIRNIEQREPYIKDIIAQAGDKKFIWIGPPNWAEDTGINDLIVKNVGKDRFFESKKLTYERGPDGAHPTWSSAAIWADSIATWIMRDGRHKILLRRPPEDPS